VTTVAAELELPRGVLVLSFDTELSWGRLDRKDLTLDVPLHRRTAEIMPRLLKAFEDHGIAATWAVVGYLWSEQGGALDDFTGLSALRPELDDTSIRASTGGHWPVLAARGILDAIRASRIKHEIGSHSCSHLLFAGPDPGADRAEEDVRRAVAIARMEGIRMESFVFPRNRVGHLDLLKRYGFRAYRAPDRSRFENRLPPTLFGIARWLEGSFAMEPITGRPRLDPSGLVEIPGGLLFREPPRRVGPVVSVRTLIRRAKKGIDAAVRERSVFHLWAPLANLAHKPDDHLRAVEEILGYAALLRARDALDVMTMGELAEQVGAAAG
jgi:peptidoglycan/xylan/chitin deacetylase (PgdA/CDA1 family)